MFRIVNAKATIAIPANSLRPKIDLDKLLLDLAREEYEDRYLEGIGYVIAVTSAKSPRFATVFPRSGNLYTEAEMEMLVWYPLLKEVIYAEVVDVREFGVFLQIGPIEGLVHISQVLDDFVSYDKRGARILAKKTKRILNKFDDVRARIISVSSGQSESFKLAFTMRQPFLGKLEWIKEDLEKIAKKK